jgi:hypothetical protein
LSPVNFAVLEKKGTDTIFLRKGRDVTVKIERFFLDPLIVPLLESRHGSKSATAGKTD